MDSNDMPTNTDRAIVECDEMIRTHRKESGNTVVVGAALLITFFTVAAYFVLVAMNSNQKHTGSFPVLAAASAPMPAGPLEIATISTQFSNSALLGFIAIFVIIFSIFVSIYRFHLNEIAKAEHYKIGFMRIRIAATNTKPAYQSEVRKALTEQAFAYEAPSHGLFKNKRVESPLPGHPTSDVAAHLLDKLLDKFEMVERKKKDEGSNE